MQLKFILDEPLLNLSEIRIKLHDKFVWIVRGRSPIFSLELSERMLQLISLLCIHPDFQTWFDGHDSTLITWRIASQYVNGRENNWEFCRRIRNSERKIWLESLALKDISVTKLESRQMRFTWRGKLCCLESGDMIQKLWLSNMWSGDKPGVRLPSSNVFL